MSGSESLAALLLLLFARLHLGVPLLLVAPAAVVRLREDGSVRLFPSVLNVTSQREGTDEDSSPGDDPANNTDDGASTVYRLSLGVTIGSLSSGSSSGSDAGVAGVADGGNITNLLNSSDSSGSSMVITGTATELRVALEDVAYVPAPDWNSALGAAKALSTSLLYQNDGTAGEASLVATLAAYNDTEGSAAANATISDAAAPNPESVTVRFDVEAVNDAPVWSFNHSFYGVSSSSSSSSSS